MKNLRTLCAFLLLVLLYFSCIPALAADILIEEDSIPAPPELTVEAGAAILMDCDTGDVLYRLNDTQEMYPASTTKIMTCYLALKYLDINSQITIPDGIMEGISAGASTADLESGEIMTVYQLLQCLMIVSANEAANAVAILVSGTIGDFVNLMNQEALALGCTGSNFVNPNGLHDEAHYSCALDLARIAQAAMQYGDFQTICSTATAVIPATNLSEERSLSTTNYLISGSDYPEYAYDGAIGIKTGFTTPAGYCLVAATQQNGRTLISVVLDAESETTDDGIKVSGCFTQTRALMDWGYANYDLAVAYQSWLDEKAAEAELSPSPEPSPSPSPSPTPTPEPTPSPSPSPSPTPSPSIAPSPSSVPEPSPSVSVSGNAETLIQAAAENLGVSTAALLWGVVITATVMLCIAIILAVWLVKRR